MSGSHRGPYRAASARPSLLTVRCPATVQAGALTVRCQRLSGTDGRSIHEVHVVTARYNVNTPAKEYDLKITWRQTMPVPERPPKAHTSLSRYSHCGFCREAGHYKRTCPLLEESA